ITSVTALELLGSDYKYKTSFFYNGKIEKGTLEGNIMVEGTGDPTLGSWRYASTKEDVVLGAIIDALRKKGINRVNGQMVAHSPNFETQTIPGGWIWDDIGNYYGAGSSGLNWRENQYDLKLKPGSRVGDPCEIIGTDPRMNYVNFYSDLPTGKKGRGDNAYIYLPPQSPEAIVRGTIPLGESPFTFSGSFPNPPMQFMNTISEILYKEGFSDDGPPDFMLESYEGLPAGSKELYIHYSPSLDSIVFWFNRRSINLYGEALLKTLAFEKYGSGRRDSGLAIQNRFWEERGIAEEELNMYDGSGLSPLNRVTTHSHVEVLKYARKQKWYPAFYDALPVFNSMKMKSGTINGVKSFCGYHKSASGREYVFSFIVNNYNGRASTLVNKMYRVLDVLK